jgi:hypothetical protein
MAEQVQSSGTANPQSPNAQSAQPEFNFSAIFSTIVRGIFFYYLFQTLMGSINTSNTPPASTAPEAAYSSAEPHESHDPLNVASQKAYQPLARYDTLINKWTLGTSLDFYFYLTENKELDFEQDSPVWMEQQITYGNFDDDLKAHVSLSPSKVGIRT